MSKKNNQNHTSEAHMGELDKVRTILFGDKIQMYEERIVQIEASVANSLIELREMIEDRFKIIEGKIEEHIAGLDTKFEEERVERDELRSVLDGGVQNVNTQLAESQQELQTRLNEMAEALVTEQNTLSDSVNEKVEALTRTIGSMEREKMNRNDLVHLLTRIAQEIQEESS